MKKRILLIDEDKEQFISFLEILKHCQGPFKCTHATSGRQAIELLQHTVPDIIFINYELSEIDALQVVSAIRFQSRLKETKVYLYSDNITDENSKMARMLGATGCIEMSAEQSDLIHKFKAIFSPELLPSYVFLKNYRNQFMCFNAMFLNPENDDEETRDSKLRQDNYAPANGMGFQNQAHSESMERITGEGHVGASL